MPKQFVNQEISRAEERTGSVGPSMQKKINRVAERVARRSTKTVQRYENEHQGIFSR
jgi:hypothetical protein